MRSKRTDYCIIFSDDRVHKAIKKGTVSSSFIICDPAGARTQDPILKRDVLYQLSY
jgi:hypothetical protein